MPADAAARTAAGRQTQNGIPKFTDRTAEVYAPMAYTATCPTVTCPQNPLTILRPVARMIMMQMKFSK